MNSWGLVALEPGLIDRLIRNLVTKRGQPRFQHADPVPHMGFQFHGHSTAF